MKLIERPAYPEELTACMNDDLVKVITGIRRCGKTYLLFELFQRHLLGTGVPEDHVIASGWTRRTSPTSATRTPSTSTS